MNARVWAARLLAGVACAALLAGCASAGNGSQDPMTVVKGTVKCPTIEFASPTPDANGIQAIRDGTVECTIKADDPRVSGTRTRTKSPGNSTPSALGNTARTSKVPVDGFSLLLM